MFKLDREKYIQIMKSQGIEAAVTALHVDKNQFEIETFEGQDGYQREMWDYLEEVRKFSRELWDINLYGLDKDPTQAESA